MPRRWRGAITLENTQTGDGRVFAPGAIEWADLPLPLNWMSDGASLHVDLATTTPQVGTIETITREGDQIIGEGELYDTTEEGAEVIRRLDAGEAPLGSRFPVSIDPDNWEVEVILTDVAEADDIMIMFSGQGAPPARDALRARLASALRAAAGDPDPGENGGEGGELLFQDSVDEILERYTRLRIRGATLCDIAAFDGAFIELTGEASETAAPAVEPEATVAAASTVDLAHPPACWFSMPEPEAGDERLVEQPDGSWAVPLTITAEGQVFGHIARLGQSHRGYTERVVPPTSSTGYREFHVGYVVADDGTEIPTGALVVGADHAPIRMAATGARDHYANSGLGWADGRCSDGRFGVWFSGSLRPNLTEEDLRVLRALTPSGDWRPVNGHGLELVSVLSVNTPGFPVARETLAASALPAPTDLPPPRLAMGEDDEVLSLVAAMPVLRCAECAERRRATLLASTPDRIETLLIEHRELLRRLDVRTRHLEPLAASALAERVHQVEAAAVETTEGPRRFIRVDS